MSDVWYVVTGRVEYDDEDTCDIILCANTEEAEKLFRERVAETRFNEDDEQEEIYINFVIRCGSEEPMMERLPG